MENKKKFEYTEREKVIVELYQSVLKEKEEKIKELEFIILMNKKYLKYTDCKII